MNKNLYDIWGYNPSDEATGIFYELLDLGGSAFGLTTDNVASLDMEYFLNRSGEKSPSALIKKYRDAIDEGDFRLLAKVGVYVEDGDYSSGNSILYRKTASDYTHAMREEVAKVIYAKFAYNWTKMYEAFTTDYAPLENYSMSENSTDDDTENGTRNDTVSIDSAVSDSSNTTTTTNVDNATRGYNSSTEVPTTSQETTTNVVGSADDNVTTTKGTNETTATDSKTAKHEHTLTRSGNIGVTTSQQMLESEIELRKWSLFESYMSDIDTILTRRLYC